MTYVQTKDGSYPGMVSKGFAFGAGLLWPALEGILLQEVVQGIVTDVTIGGHSLGAAMATLLSHKAQVRQIVTLLLQMVQILGNSWLPKFICSGVTCSLAAAALL
jgi:hypothetical protein